MNFQFTEKQHQLRQKISLFTSEYISPFAAEFERQQSLPDSLVRLMAGERYLAPTIASEFGGAGYQWIDFAILNEAVGQGCSSARSLITVHSMVAYAIERWGSQQQKLDWLEDLAFGRKIASFALSEPDTGSNGAGVAASAEPRGQEYTLNGHKQWISFGQIADLLLVFAQQDGKPLACLVESSRPGICIEPINNISGCRASLLANIYLDDCRIPKSHVLGGIGFGFSAVALSALTIGRLSVASGCVGMGQACMEASFEHAGKRQQFAQPIGDFQLVRRMLANMKTRLEAARLLTYQGALAMDAGLSEADEKIMLAKYFAATTAADVARDTVQIHGARGCIDDHLASRFYRDAKVMEIIEGSNEMHQLILGASI
ncbi:acyl-CoA dehydrogenase family protein [Microbulbifer sp. ZKSA006]|uniref:acyl-CoA dehydrogenase family protein n=1 Tax=Microbulbifer sp. ZKSA006 TaxID=3243390 RepID=UPI00403A2464